MQNLSQLLQTGDWKGEKHVPVIHVPNDIKTGEDTEIRVSIGDEIKHPNTLEHHIKWIKLFYFTDDKKFPVQLASFEFTSHGEAGLFTEPVGVTSVKLEKPGVVYALAYCNIHGLWENSIEIEIK